MKEISLDEKVINSIERISSFLRYLLWERGKNLKLSPLQIQFLLFLREKPKKYRKITELSREYHLKPPTVSDAIKSLEEKGYIYRENDRKDKRIHYLSLTPKGKNLTKKLLQWENQLKKEIKNIPEEKKRHFFEFFVDLVERLYFKNLIKAVRICPTCRHLHRHKDENRMIYRCLLLNKEIEPLDMRIDCPSHIPALQY